VFCIFFPFFVFFLGLFFLFKLGTGPLTPRFHEILFIFFFLSLAACGGFFPFFFFPDARRPRNFSLPSFVRFFFFLTTRVLPSGLTGCCPSCPLLFWSANPILSPFFPLRNYFSGFVREGGNVAGCFFFSYWIPIHLLFSREEKWSLLIGVPFPSV